MDSRKKSIYKTISWRIIALMITFSISLMVFGSFTIAGTVALADMAVKTIAYYFHERLWVNKMV